MDEADSFDEKEFTDDRFRAFLDVPPTPVPTAARRTFDLNDFDRVKVFEGGVSGEERWKGWAFTFKIVVGLRSAGVRQVCDLCEHADPEEAADEIAARDEGYAARIRLRQASAELFEVL